MRPGRRVTYFRATLGGSVWPEMARHLLCGDYYNNLLSRSDNTMNISNNDCKVQSYDNQRIIFAVELPVEVSGQYPQY